MTRTSLRYVLREAKKDNASGLLVWKSWDAWDSTFDSVSPESHIYKVVKHFMDYNLEEYQSYFDFFDPKILAFSFATFKSKKKTLDALEELFSSFALQGPIALFPSGRIVEVS